MKRTFLVLMAFLYATGSVFAQSRTYVFATYTYSTNNRLQNLEPLAGYLSAKTGMNIKAVSYPTVAALIRAIWNDSVDFAMMNTSGYLVLQRNYPDIVLPLVNLDMGGSQLTNYGGCLIASKISGIVSLDQLTSTGKRHSLSLVGSSSTSGNLVPRLLLNEKKISDAEKNFNVTYAGTHRAVVETVLAGMADIGGCGCAEVDSARKHLDFDNRAIVLGSFNDIPLGPIVYNKKVEPSILKIVYSYLLSLHNDSPGVFVNFCNGWTEFKGATRFSKVSDKDYNRFRLMFGDNEELWRMIE